MNDRNKPEARLDRDLVPVTDSRETQLRRLKEHLSRPITAREANGKIRLHGDALRRHADLANAPEHPYTRLVREHREALGE